MVARTFTGTGKILAGPSYHSLKSSIHVPIADFCDYVIFPDPDLLSRALVGRILAGYRAASERFQYMRSQMKISGLLEGNAESNQSGDRNRLVW